MNPRTFRTVLAASAATCALGYLATAGPLNPPAGPVASTYKTLGDVEPRIAINATNTPGTSGAVFSISQPGSYYLTGNVTGVAFKNGIEVLAANVTIDLNGFTLTGAPNSQAGIFISGASSRVNIRNGTLISWGFDGIDGGFSSNGTFERITAMNNGGGVGGRLGIRVGSNMHLRDCIASSNTGGGISANDNCELIDCTAVSNTQSGYTLGSANVLRGCNARSNNVSGFVMVDSNTIENCAAVSNTGAGFSAGAGDTFTACTGAANSNNFSAGTRSSLTNCSAHSAATGDGITLTGTGCKAVGCTADNNAGRGIYLQTSGSITNCTCSANSLLGVYLGPHSRIANSHITGSNGNGIFVDNGGDCEILDNTCNQNGLGGSGSGIYISPNAPNCRIEHNMLSSNYQNLTVVSTGNLVVRNSLSSPGNGGQYSLVIPQGFGPFVNVNAAASMSTISGSEHAQANFMR